MSEKYRCAICNKVDDQSIETNAGDFSCEGFYPDPKNQLHSVCMSCKEVIEELKLDYEQNDDIYGWDAFDFGNDNSSDKGPGQLQRQDAQVDEGQTVLHTDD